MNKKLKELYILRYKTVKSIQWTAQKIELFIITTVRTSDPTKEKIVHRGEGKQL
jgi:hypothetical protein